MCNKYAVRILTKKGKHYDAKVVVFNEVIFNNDDRRKKSRIPRSKSNG